MFQLLQKIIRWLKGWLVIRPRSFIKLLSHKELYDTVSYFPEQSKHRRTTRQIFLDQCQSIVKYGSPNKYYFPYGLDVKSKKTHEEYVHFDYFLIGFKTSSPPIHGLKTSGMTTEPSSCWNCSKIAGKIRLVAKPDAFKV